MAQGRKVFMQKNIGSTLYKWSPEPTNYDNKNRINKINDFCNATAGSQGQDWITTYVYDVTAINHQQARLAYVECGYVE